MVDQPSSFDANGVQFAWNAHSIKLVEECLRKYYYIMIEGWQSPERSVHLRFGGHFATALEHYYKHRAEGADSVTALEKVVHEALIDTWDYIDAEGNPWNWDEAPDGMMPSSGSPWQSDHTAKTRENLIRTIVWYVDQFENESISVITVNGKPAVELSFALPVDDGIVFAGHLDRLVDYGGHTYVMDQKTTQTTVTQNFFNQFSPDTQMSMYTFAGKAVFSAPVKGVIIDAAQIAVGFSRFERGFTFRTDDQLNEWYDSAMHHIELARKATLDKHFPMNTTSCGNYGGCPFRDVCSRSPSVRENFLTAKFVKGRPLQPLDQR